MNGQQPAILPITEAIDRIKVISTPINKQQATGNQRHVARIWSKVELDGLILNAPNHDGQLENIAREVYHRLAARFLGAEIYTLQQRFMWFSLILAGFGCVLNFVVGLILAGVFTSRENTGFGIPGANVLAGAGGFLLGLLPSILIGAAGAYYVWSNAPDLMRSGKLQALKKEALEAVRRCFLRAIPPDTKPDLHDLWRHGWLTNQSRPLSAEIVDTDAASMVTYDVVKMWGACAIAWVAAGVLGTVPVLGLLGQFFLIQMLMVDGKDSCKKPTLQKTVVPLRGDITDGVPQ